MLQLGRPYKSFSPHWCILCMGSGELNHLFLHCLLTLGLWHKLLRLVKMVWVPSRSNCDMMTISYRGLGSSIRGKTLWEMFHSMLLYCRYANINIYWWQKKEKDNSLSSRHPSACYLPALKSSFWYLVCYYQLMILFILLFCILLSAQLL